jgi:putative chitinase
MVESERVNMHTQYRRNTEAVMSVLQPNSSGEEVKNLQTKLKERGFNPGAIDGDFGPATEAAVLAFQKSE